MDLGASNPKRLSSKALAIKTSIALRKKFPIADFHSTYNRRGTPESLLAFGESWKLANADQRLTRGAYGMRGRGKYSFGKSLRAAEGYSKRIGRMAGAGINLYNKLKGGGLYTGAGLYTGPGLYTGAGAYEAEDEVHANALFDGSKHIPMNVQSVEGEDGSVIITHREYLTDVYGPGVAGDGIVYPFNNLVIPINPGIQQSFPWLSQVAENFDEYEFGQLAYEYRSTTTDIGSSTTGQCGTIVMTTNYNAAAPSYTDKQQMVQNQNSNSFKVTDSGVHFIECANKKGKEGWQRVALSSALFVRTNPVVTGQDLKTYDRGKFQLATCNTPPAYNGLPLGELWVTYQVRVNKCKLFTTRGSGIDRDLFCQSTSVARGATATQASPWLGKMYKGEQNNIGVLWSPVTANPLKSLLTFPASYVGNVAIKVYTSCLAALVVNQTAPSIAPEGSANISYINDMYNVDGVPVAAYSSPTIVAPITGDVYQEVHFFVGSSKAGVNNAVSIIFPATVGTVATFTNIEVVQYNGNGLVSGTDLLTWVNPALPGVGIAGNAI